VIHNFDDDKKYTTFEFEDEVSSYTPGARWVYGGEYFAATLRCRIPKRIVDKSHLVDEFVNRHDGDTGFWV
jgi:hypothetical protein